MNFPDLIFVLTGSAGIILFAFALLFLLTFKKRKAYLESMKQELLKISEETLPKHVHEKYETEMTSEYLKNFLEEKKEDVEALVAKLRKTEFWGDAEIYYRIGIFYYRRKDYDLAIDNFEKALHINPNQKMVYFNMGASYFILENWARAIECFNKSIERGEEEAYSYYNLGWIYDEKNDYEKAIECYEQSLETAYDAIYNKACALAKWGKEDEAIRELGKIVNKGDFKDWMLKDDDLENLRKQGKIESLVKAKSSRKH